MVFRPIFRPRTDGSALVETRSIEFQWFPGFAVSQKQKSIAAFHAAAAAIGIAKSLEISSKSTHALGVAASAFNLQFAALEGREVTVEAAFQSSKCFENGGPFLDMLHMAPRDAKRDPRLTSSGPLIGFDFLGEKWALEPKTAFYDWTYVQALRSSDLGDKILTYDAFTDIEFNSAKSINCQAHSAALFCSLHRRGLLDRAMASKSAFVEIAYRND